MKREEIYQSIYLAGCVKRYSTWPMLKEQTVGHHCWRVATIFVEIFGLPRAEVLYYILHHDSGELWAGDLPFGVKAKVPGLKAAMVNAEAMGLERLKIVLPELTVEELRQCKICDLLEMHETGRHEMNMGNKYAEPIVLDTLAAAKRLAIDSNLWPNVMRWLEGIYGYPGTAIRTTEDAR